MSDKPAWLGEFRRRQGAKSWLDAYNSRFAVARMLGFHKRDLPDPSGPDARGSVNGEPTNRASGEFEC